jgi:hypothetical protein
VTVVVTTGATVVVTIGAAVVVTTGAAVVVTTGAAVVVTTGTAIEMDGATCALVGPVNRARSAIEFCFNCKTTVPSVEHVTAT